MSISHSYGARKLIMRFKPMLLKCARANCGTLATLNVLEAVYQDGVYRAILGAYYTTSAKSNR